MKEIVYVANSISQNIEVWNLSKTGEMNIIQSIKTEGQVQPLKIIKNRNLLYAGLRPNNKIITYHINNIGCLKKKNESIIPGKPNYIAFDRAKNFLFCSSYHNNCMSVSRLNQDGVPQNPIQVIYDVAGCHSAKINYKHNILFVISLQEDSIYLYYLTNSGILKSTDQKVLHVKKKSGPRHIAFHPNQDIVYTINELSGTIDVWKINKKNNMTYVDHMQNISISKNSFSGNYWSSDIHITKCGRFLYASDRVLHIISLFHVHQETHKITFFKSYLTAKQPRSFCINYNSTRLIVAGEKSNQLIIYNISNETGELLEVNRYSTSDNPIWILIHPLEN